MKETLQQKWNGNIDLTKKYNHSHIYKLLEKAKKKLNEDIIVECLTEEGIKVYRIPDEFGKKLWLALEADIKGIKGVWQCHKEDR